MQHLQKRRVVPLVGNRPCRRAPSFQIPIRQQQSTAHTVGQQTQDGVDVPLLWLQKRNAVHHLGGIIIALHSPLVDILDYIRDHIRVSEVHAAKGHGNQREVDLIRNGNQCIVDLRNKDPNVKQNKPCRAHASQMSQYTALSGNIIFNGHESRYNQFVSDN